MSMDIISLDSEMVVPTSQVRCKSFKMYISSAVLPMYAVGYILVLRPSKYPQMIVFNP
jgi:hypothetical protein